MTGTDLTADSDFISKSGNDIRVSQGVFRCPGWVPTNGTNLQYESGYGANAYKNDSIAQDEGFKQPYKLGKVKQPSGTIYAGDGGEPTSSGDTWDVHKLVYVWGGNLADKRWGSGITTGATSCGATATYPGNRSRNWLPAKARRWTTTI